MSSDPRTPDSDDGNASKKAGGIRTDGGLDAETVLGTVDPGDVVEVAGSPYRVVDVEEDEDGDGVLRLYDLVERTETVKAAGAGDVDVYLHRSESEAIQTRVEQEREQRDVQEESDDVDEGEGVATDGGSEFSDRVDEMIEEIEEEVDDSTPAEAMLYARCCAAFEHAYNDTDLPPENGLGVMTAALFEAADRAGISRVDVIESAREYVDDQEVEA